MHYRPLKQICLHSMICPVISSIATAINHILVYLLGPQASLETRPPSCAMVKSTLLGLIS